MSCKSFHQLSLLGVFVLLHLFMLMKIMIHRKIYFAFYIMFCVGNKNIGSSELRMTQWDISILYSFKLYDLS